MFIFFRSNLVRRSPGFDPWASFVFDLSNDLSTVLRNSSYHCCCADDVQIYVSFDRENFDFSVSRLNDDLQSIAAWAERDGLTLNPTKCQAIVISRNSSFSNIVSPFHILGQRIALSPKVVSLGLTTNHSLT